MSRYFSFCAIISLLLGGKCSKMFKIFKRSGASIMLVYHDKMSQASLAVSQPAKLKKTAALLNLKLVQF